MRWMAAHEWAPATRKSVRDSVIGFYGWLLATGRLHASPAVGLPTVTVPLGVPRPAGDQQIAQALDRADRRTLLMLRLAAELGARVAEVASVHTERVEDEGLRLAGKGGRERVVPMPADLRRAILASPSGWVFPGRDPAFHLTPEYVGKLMRRVLPPGITPHMLRHAAASAWRARGLDITEIRDLLGHASVRTTQVYVMPLISKYASVIDAAAARFRTA